MVHSMTAFARIESSVADATVCWEIRSVNHRYLETVFRLPEGYRDLEPALREAIRRRFKRGKLDPTLNVTLGPGTKGYLEIDRAVLLSLLATMEQVRRDAPEFGHPSALELLRWPGVLASGEGDVESVKSVVLETFEAALTELAAHRTREGAALAAGLIDRLAAVQEIVVEVRALSEGLTAALKERLVKRIEELTRTLDPERLEQEVALLVSRGDVAEELDRLEIHVGEAQNALDQAGPHGRRLDFLMQELNREANTLAAKAQLPEISQHALDLKVVIEQLREQVQNVE